MTNHKRSVVTGVLVTALAAVTAACGADATPAASAGATAAAEPVTINVHTFGGGENFGYDAAVEKWNAEHPNIQIKYCNLTDSSRTTTCRSCCSACRPAAAPATWSASTRACMGLFKAHAAVLRRPRRARPAGPQGRLPALEVGARASTPTASCSASAPTSAAWPCATARTCSRRPGCPPTATRSPRSGRPGTPTSSAGKQFQADDQGAKFVDGPNTSTTRSCTQEAAKNGNVTYFDKDNKLIVDTNPAVKKAWDSVQKISRGRADRQAAGLLRPPWNAGFKKGAFATIACPAWMLGFIKAQAGDAQQGQVGRRRGPRRRRQLGRLLADRAEAEQAPEGGRRAGRLPDRQGRPESRRSRRRAPSRRTPAPAGPGDPSAHERVLQQRADRPDLRRPAPRTLQPVFLGAKDARSRRGRERARRPWSRAS